MSFRYAYLYKLQSFRHEPAQLPAPSQGQAPHLRVPGFLTYLPGKMVQNLLSKCLINSIPSIRNCQDNFILLSLRRYCNGSIYPIIFNCIFNEIINHPINQNITSCQYQFILWLFVLFTLHATSNDSSVPSDLPSDEFCVFCISSIFFSCASGSKSASTSSIQPLAFQSFHYALPSAAHSYLKAF